MVRCLTDLLADQLGQFSNGAPAVWVHPPQLNTKMTVTGLLCKIHRYQDVTAQTHSRSTNQSLREFDWKVYLIQYDRGEAGMRKLGEAKQRMEDLWPNIESKQLDTVSKAYPQIMFDIPFCEYRNTFANARATQ